MIKIIYDNIWARVDSCPAHINVILHDALRYHPDGYTHQYNYKAKRWDGYNYIYDLKNSRFRRGLLNRVTKLLRDSGETVVLEDATTDTQELAHKFEGGLLRALDFQERATVAATKNDMGLVVSPTGCHAAGQGIMMANGSIKKVEDIVVGDNIMGWNNTSREVLQLIRNNGNMVKITPIKGEPFIVNEDHILTLQKTKEHKDDEKYESIVDVSVKDYIKWSNTQKHLYKLFRVGIDSFNIEQDLEVDPYLLGLLLGDGTISNRVSIEINEDDIEIIDYINATANIYGLNVTKYNKYNNKLNRHSKSSSYVLSSDSGLVGSNKLRSELQTIGVFGCVHDTKHIPHKYLVSARNARLELLAGIIDSDGSLSNGVIDYISSSRQLSYDVTFLARSLGLAAYITECTKGCSTSEYVGRYWRVCISGDNDIIPTKLARKQAQPRLQKKSVLRTGFSVEPIGMGDYYGFTISGDGRYLLDDFTVTHNSGKTVIAAKMIAEVKRKTLVVVTDIVLLDQMQQALQKWFDQPIGMVGDGEFELEDITVSTIQSIASILKLKSKKPAALDKYNKLTRFISEVGLFLSDEAHLSDSDSFDIVIPNFKNTKRFIGLSATPYGWAEKSEKRSNMALEQHFGSIIFDGRGEDFILLGVKAPLNVFVHKLDPVNLEYVKHFKYGYGGKKQPDSSKNYRDCLETEILHNEIYQARIAHDAMLQVADGKSVFVHAVHSLDFGDALATRLPGALVVNGKTPRKQRREIYEAIQNKEQMILVSDVGGTGLNIPSLDTIILASDLVDIRQIKGRVERASPNKKCGNILDYRIDTMFLGKHHETRISQYENDNNGIIYE